MWNVKYYYTFKSLNEDKFKVEILTEATGVTTPTEIIGAATPCTLEFPTYKKLDIIGIICYNATSVIRIFIDRRSLLWHLNHLIK